MLNSSSTSNGTITNENSADNNVVEVTLIETETVDIEPFDEIVDALKAKIDEQTAYVNEKNTLINNLEDKLQTICQNNVDLQNQLDAVT